MTSAAFGPGCPWHDLHQRFAPNIGWCEEKLCVLFAPATAVAGITFFVYHQRLNAFSQMLDFFGMFGFCVLLLMANLQRMRRWPAGARGLAR